MPWKSVQCEPSCSMRTDGQTWRREKSLLAILRTRLQMFRFKFMYAHVCTGPSRSLFVQTKTFSSYSAGYYSSNFVDVFWGDICFESRTDIRLPWVTFLADCFISSRIVYLIRHSHFLYDIFHFISDPNIWRCVAWATTNNFLVLYSVVLFVPTKMFLTEFSFSMSMVRVKRNSVWGCIFTVIVSKSSLHFQIKCTKYRSLKRFCIMAGLSERVLSICLPVFGLHSCFGLSFMSVGSTEICASSPKAI